MNIQENNLINSISKHLLDSKKKHYRLFYNWVRFKRYVILNIIVLLIQYMSITQGTTIPPNVPMSPPLGIAFVIFYLLGNNALLGLLLGGICAYAVKGFSISLIGLYLTADIGVACLSAVACQRIFSSDVSYYISLSEWLKFIGAITVVAFISSSVKYSAIEIKLHEFSLSDYLGLWLSDLNGILIIFSFLVSWMPWYYSRTNPLHNKVSHRQIILFFVYLIVVIICMRRLESIYLIIMGMLITIHCAKHYGEPVSTTLLYVTATLYTTYFIIFYKHFIAKGHLCPLIPLILFIFAFCVIYLSNIFAHQYLVESNKAKIDL